MLVKICSEREPRVAKARIVKMESTLRFIHLSDSALHQILSYTFFKLNTKYFSNHQELTLRCENIEECVAFLSHREPGRNVISES